MIISVAELRKFVQTDETDQVLEFRIQALESFICAYTNNNFKDRSTGKVFYPPDVKRGAIAMAQWDIEKRDSLAGIASETISRHSVTYADAGTNNDTAGYPRSVVGFLQPYIRARF